MYKQQTTENTLNNYAKKYEEATLAKGQDTEDFNGEKCKAIDELVFPALMKDYSEMAKSAKDDKSAKSAKDEKSDSKSSSSDKSLTKLQKAGKNLIAKRNACYKSYWENSKSAPGPYVERTAEDFMALLSEWATKANKDDRAKILNGIAQEKRRKTCILRFLDKKIIDKLQQGSPKNKKVLNNLFTDEYMSN